MKMLLCGAALLVGCTSLREKVTEEIQLGDSETTLITALGQPNSLVPSRTVPGATTYIYEDGTDICSFAIKDRTIAKLMCVRDRRPTSNSGIDLDALAKAVRQPVHDAPAPSDQPSKQIDYTCLNGCLHRGYQYGLCQSRCEY